MDIDRETDTQKCQRRQFMFAKNVRRGSLGREINALTFGSLTIFIRFSMVD